MAIQSDMFTHGLTYDPYSIYTVWVRARRQIGDARFGVTENTKANNNNLTQILHTTARHELET